MDRVLIGKGEEQVHLLARYGNRHGLVAGATGTGKTISLMVLAEGFSRLGVPVFMADVKGDVAGLAMAGGESFSGAPGPVPMRRPAVVRPPARRPHRAAAPRRRRAAERNAASPRRSATTHDQPGHAGRRDTRPATAGDRGAVARGQDRSGDRSTFRGAPGGAPGASDARDPARAPRGCAGRDGSDRRGTPPAVVRAGASGSSRGGTSGARTGRGGGAKKDLPDPDRGCRGRIRPPGTLRGPRAYPRRASDPRGARIDSFRPRVHTPVTRSIRPPAGRADGTRTRENRQAICGVERCRRRRGAATGTDPGMGDGPRGRWGTAAEAGDRPHDARTDPGWGDRPRDGGQTPHVMGDRRRDGGQTPTWGTDPRWGTGPRWGTDPEMGDRPRGPSGSPERADRRRPASDHPTGPGDPGSGRETGKRSLVPASPLPARVPCLSHDPSRSSASSPSARSPRRPVAPRIRHRVRAGRRRARRLLVAARHP